jgi:hypothetical protein
MNLKNQLFLIIRTGGSMCHLWLDLCSGRDFVNLVVGIYYLTGKYFHDIVLVPLVPLGKSWPLMCGDVCVMCVCGGDASYDTNGTKAMAPKCYSRPAPKCNFYIIFQNSERDLHYQVKLENPNHSYFKLHIPSL